MTIWTLLFTVLALVSASGAAFTLLYEAQLRSKVDSLESRVMSIQSRMGHDEERIRKLIEEQLEIHAPEVEESGGGMDDMAQMMMMQMLQQQQQPTQPAPQPPRTEEAPPNDETPSEPERRGEQQGVLELARSLNDE